MKTYYTKDQLFVFTAKLLGKINQVNLEALQVEFRDALEYSKYKPIHELAIDLNLVTADEAFEIENYYPFSEQKLSDIVLADVLKSHKLVNESDINLGFIEQEQAFTRQKKLLSLGDYLIAKNIITQVKIAELSTEITTKTAEQVETLSVKTPPPNDKADSDSKIAIQQEKNLETHREKISAQNYSDDDNDDLLILEDDDEPAQTEANYDQVINTSERETNPKQQTAISTTLEEKAISDAKKKADAKLQAILNDISDEHADADSFNDDDFQTAKTEESEKPVLKPESRKLSQGSKIIHKTPPAVSKEGTGAVIKLKNALPGSASSIHSISDSDKKTGTGKVETQKKGPAKTSSMLFERAKTGRIQAAKVATEATDDEKARITSKMLKPTNVSETRLIKNTKIIEAHIHQLIEDVQKLSKFSHIDPEFDKGVPLGDKFYLYKELSRNSDGVMFLARQIEKDRIVPLKILSAELTGDVQKVVSFYKRATIIMKIDHPNLIKVVHVGKVDELHYVVFEWLTGKPVIEILKNDRKMSLSKAAKIIAKTAKALDFALSRNLTHGDVNLNNLWIADDGSIKILNLGLNDSLLEKYKAGKLYGQAICNPQFCAPEIVKGEKSDWKSDLYSLGICFYALLTGKFPYFADTNQEILDKHINAALPFPSKIDSSLSVADNVFSMLLAKDPKNRYTSYNGLIEALKVLMNFDSLGDELQFCDRCGHVISKTENCCAICGFKIQEDIVDEPKEPKEPKPVGLVMPPPVIEDEIPELEDEPKNPKKLRTRTHRKRRRF